LLQDLELLLVGHGNLGFGFKLGRYILAPAPVTKLRHATQSITKRTIADIGL
jgi:hypothetical protein